MNARVVVRCKYWSQAHIRPVSQLNRLRVSIERVKAYCRCSRMAHTTGILINGVRGLFDPQRLLEHPLHRRALPGSPGLVLQKQPVGQPTKPPHWHSRVQLPSGNAPPTVPRRQLDASQTRLLAQQKCHRRAAEQHFSCPRQKSLFLLPRGR